MFKRDLCFGLQNEETVLLQIRTYFNNNNIIKDDNKYAAFDFYSDDCLYELKTRRNKYNTYPDTIFPKHKLDNTNDVNKKRILLFSFTDGLYFIEYNKDLFDTFPIQNKRYRHDRMTYNGNSIDKITDYYNIPISALTKITF